MNDDGGDMTDGERLRDLIEKVASRPRTGLVAGLAAKRVWVRELEDLAIGQRGDLTPAEAIEVVHDVLRGQQ